MVNQKGMAVYPPVYRDDDLRARPRFAFQWGDEISHLRRVLPSDVDRHRVRDGVDRHHLELGWKPW